MWGIFTTTFSFCFCHLSNLNDCCSRLITHCWFLQAFSSCRRANLGELQSKQISIWIRNSLEAEKRLIQEGVCDVYQFAHNVLHKTVISLRFLKSTMNINSQSFMNLWKLIHGAIGVFIECNMLKYSPYVYANHLEFTRWNQSLQWKGVSFISGLSYSLFFYLLLLFFSH